MHRVYSTVHGVNSVTTVLRGTVADNDYRYAGGMQQARVSAVRAVRYVDLAGVR